MNYQTELLPSPQPELTQEDKLWFRAALKECQATAEHLQLIEVVNHKQVCFNCQQ